MPIPIVQLVAETEPESTVLLFGAGSSIPSGAPSAAEMLVRFGKEFERDPSGYSLSEFTTFLERDFSRRRLIECLRNMLGGLQPTGGLRNISLYKWKSIYTTKYDELIELSYLSRNDRTRIYSSNFDFTLRSTPNETDVFKFHGTINKDISEGYQSRIVITETDYEYTNDYREYIYDRLKGDLAGANLIVIGHSLSDLDVKDIVNRAAAINAKLLSPARVTLLLYTADADRASLYEKRGISVCFGSIDDFFLEMSKKTISKSASGPLDKFPALSAKTVDIDHALQLLPDISMMFNGRSASYADIEVGHTFTRTTSDDICKYFDKENSLCAILLGASGTGKTTCARQALRRLNKEGLLCFEHAGDSQLYADEWAKFALEMRKNGSVGVLFIDDAHVHLQEVNDLVDRLVSDDNAHNTCLKS